MLVTSEKARINFLFSNCWYYYEKDLRQNNQQASSMTEQCKEKKEKETNLILEVMLQ